MGRAFEYRKARKLKRWGNMSKTFTRIGKEITIAVKASGPDPANNPRLRALMQTARSENMPKDTVERAIKKATDKDAKDYKELTYEGYGPHGIAIFVEAWRQPRHTGFADLPFRPQGCAENPGQTRCIPRGPRTGTY